MDKQFRLKRLKTRVNGELVEVRVYGHAARGREAVIGEFLTTKAGLRKDLAAFLEDSPRVSVPAENI